MKAGKVKRASGTKAVGRLADNVKCLMLVL